MRFLISFLFLAYHGFSYWVRTDGRKALWYIPDFQNWALGGIQSVGYQRRSFGSEKFPKESSQCPYGASNWKYRWDYMWSRTGDDFEIKCKQGMYIDEHKFGDASHATTTLKEEEGRRVGSEQLVNIRQTSSNPCVEFYEK